MHNQKYFGIFLVVLLMMSLVLGSHEPGHESPLDGRIFSKTDLSRPLEDYFNPENYDEIWGNRERANIFIEDMQITERLSPPGPLRDDFSNRISKFNTFIGGLTDEQRVELYEHMINDPQEIREEGNIENHRRALWTHLTPENKKKLIESFKKDETTSRDNIYSLFGALESDSGSSTETKKLEDHIATEEDRTELLSLLERGDTQNLMSDIISQEGNNFGDFRKRVILDESLDGFKISYKKVPLEPPYEGKSLPERFVFEKDGKQYILPTEGQPRNVQEITVSESGVGYENRDKRNFVKVRGSNDYIVDPVRAGLRSIDDPGDKWILEGPEFSEQERRTIIHMDPNAKPDAQNIVSIGENGRIQMWGAGHLDGESGAKVSIGDRDFFPNPNSRALDDGRRYASVEILDNDIFAVEGNLQTPQLGAYIKAQDGKGIIDFNEEGKGLNRETFLGHLTSLRERLNKPNLGEDDLTILQVFKKDGETRQMEGSLTGLKDKVVFSVAEGAQLVVRNGNGPGGSIDIAGNPADNTYYSHRITETGTSTRTLDRITAEVAEGTEEIAQTWKSRTQEGSHDDSKIEVEDLRGSDPRPGSTGNNPNTDPFAEANPRGGTDIGNQPETQPGAGTNPKPEISRPQEPRIGNARPAGGTELSERISEPVKEIIPKKTVTEQPSDIAGAGRPDSDGGVFGKSSPLTVETETGTTTNVAGSKTAIPKMADKPAGQLTDTSPLKTYNDLGYRTSAYEYGALPDSLGNADASLVGPNNEQIAIKNGVAYKWEQKQVRIDYGNGYYSYQWQTQWVKQ